MWIGMIFWILMLVWFALWLLGSAASLGAYGPHVNTAFVFVLFLLLGWQVFGAPIKKG